LSTQRVQSYRRLFAAAMAAALALQPTDIHITSFSCAEYTLINSSSSSGGTADKFEQSLTDVLEADVGAGQSNRVTWDDTAAAAAAAATEIQAYADVSTIFTVTMPADVQQHSQIATTILLQSSNLLASPLSKFFALPLRAVYVATAEAQTAGDGNVTAVTAGMELPFSIPAIPSSAAAAAATAAGLSNGHGASYANMWIAATSHDQQQNKSMPVGTAAYLPSPQPSSKQPQQQQQEPKQLPPTVQQQHQQQQHKRLSPDGQYATPAPISTPGAAKKTISGESPAAVDTTKAALTAVTSIKDASVKAAPAIYTPMRPHT
jgi:hypothetical protein